MSKLRAVVVAMLFTATCWAVDLPDSYDKAAALGDAQEKAPATKAYFSKVLMPYFAGNYASVLKSCFSSVKRPDASAFSFVAAISSDGHVIRIYNNRETNIFACLRESLKDEVFPNPPVSPYYLHVDMSFNDDPPHQRVARLSPPLTVATKQNSSRSDCWHAESSTSIPRKDEMKEVESPELREPPLIEKNVEWGTSSRLFPLRLFSRIPSEKAVRLPLWAVWVVGDFDREVADDALEFAGGSEIDRLVDVVRRRMIAHVQP